jgi:hypothetical protein
MSLNDPTTKQMISAVRSRQHRNLDDVVMALLDARYRAHEITPRLDAVLAAFSIKAA